MDPEIETYVREILNTQTRILNILESLTNKENKGKLDEELMFINIKLDLMSKQINLIESSLKKE